MARNKPETQKPETQKPETENTETAVASKLFGEHITPENIARLAGVEIGFFPIKLSVSNATSSDLPLAELGVSLQPYEQDREIMITNQGMLDTFCTNCTYLANLWQWHEHNGLIIQPITQATQEEK